MLKTLIWLGDEDSLRSGGGESWVIKVSAITFRFRDGMLNLFYYMDANSHFKSLNGDPVELLKKTVVSLR
jgi:hypothetical protein